MMHGGYDAPDGPDPTQSPSDFPSDPVFYTDWPLYSLIGWALVLALIVWTVYRLARRNQWESFFAHERAVRLVEKASRQALTKAYETPGTLTPDVVGLVNDLTGESRRCGKEIKDVFGKLEKALGGVKEVDAPPGQATGAIGENSGTIINIAVSNGPNGQPVADGVRTAVGSNGQAVVQAGTPYAPPPPAPLSHQARIYKALNALHEEWKSTRSMAGVLEDARHQLIDTPVWTPPLLRPSEPVVRG
ncbi:MAG: hypothetical protein QM647_06255 [Asticcacaulis sp.]|uniref:hypothetical protein n=1 Tax=Asticcacaulis sp. TaxID=1872648 RepID=UPI0039E32056